MLLAIGQNIIYISFSLFVPADDDNDTLVKLSKLLYLGDLNQGKPRYKLDSRRMHCKYLRNS